MAYRDKIDLGPSQEEIAIAKGPFGLKVVMIVLGIVGVARFAQWLFS